MQRVPGYPALGRDAPKGPETKPSVMDPFRPRMETVTAWLEPSVQSRPTRGLSVWQIGGKVQYEFQAPGLQGFATEDLSATWREGWRNGPFVAESQE
jgi:hypothetical protein